jgi:tetratricopeptide (TPR) repeat protein
MIPPVSGTPRLQAIILVVATALALPCGMRPTSAQQPVLQPGTGSPRGLQTVPTPAFDAALAALAAGDSSRALDIASREYRGGIRVGSRRWLDSAAMAAVVGECHYELGNFREAVAAYDEALLLAAQQADWLLAVRFPASPLEAANRPRVATWLRSERGTRPANLPATALIQHAGSDPQEVLQKGGVLTAAFSSTVRPEEILRGLVISLYRRTEILGALARDGVAFNDSLRVLLRRPAPPNHYSQAWIDVALGTALWSQGKAQQAVPLLERGLVVGNRLDHGLTGWGLLVLGRIALESGNAAAAARLFEEAGGAAAEAHDARALEEALRMAFAAHMAAGETAVPPTIAAAAEWARGELPALRARLLALEAEALATAGNAQAAAARLQAIDPRILRGDPGRGAIGAQAAYAAALAALAAGDTATGSSEMERAVALSRQRSPRLHQTALVVEQVLAGSAGLSDRQAEALFTRLLADPSARDFTIDPLAALTVITAARQEAFDAWVMSAGRRGTDAFLAATDAAVRARWLGRQPFGGRRMAIDRLLDADPAALDPAAAARRAALLARHPELSRLLADTGRLRTVLTAALLEGAGAAAAGAEAEATLPGDPADWQAFREASVRRRKLVDLVAAGRDPTVIDFPPPAGTDVRARLRPREMILSFHWTGQGLSGALESRDRVALWQVPQPAAVQRELAALLHGIGLFEGTTPVASAHLASGEWQAAAAALERLLFEQSRVSLGAGIEDLVIVPDGPLWYLPFELLPVGSGAADETPRPLRDVCRVRTCPTRGLAVPRHAGDGVAGPIGVQSGRRTRGERPGESDWIGQRLAGQFDRLLPFPSRTPAAPIGLAAALCETLVVFDELAIDVPLGERTLLPATIDRAADRAPGAGAMTFADWLTAPAKRPTCVLLPGLQTPLVEATASGRGGEELFDAATGLLAAGARRAVLSRWRMGGRTAVDLIDEFLLGLAEGRTEGAESWRRAVDIVSAEAPDIAAEPRIRTDADTALPDGRHPIFWAGYILVEPGTAADDAAPGGAPPQVVR